MRIKDAIASLQLGKKKQTQVHELCTIWSSPEEDGPNAMPLAEYPRPQLRRGDWQCLNGWWEYAFRPAGEPMDEADGKILVPFSPETVRSGVGRTLQPGEALWYRRTIDLPDFSEGKRLILHFGAVDERCIVWWNGCKLGSHRNGYISFSFDVTEYARQGINFLQVCVRDDTDRGTACRGKQTLQPGGMYYHAQSGIWQTVWLEEVPLYYLDDLKVTPLPEEEAVELSLSFRGRTERESREDNGSGNAETIGDTETAENAEAIGDTEAAGDTNAIGDTEIIGSNKGSGKEKVKITVGLLSAGTGMEMSAESCEKSYVFNRKDRMKVRIPVYDPQLWSPENPVLYGLRIEAGEDLVESYFAMRSFGVGTDEEGRPCLLLNGSPYFFHGVLLL